MRTSLLVLGVAGCSACVFPTDEPTGVELSWRFVEVNVDDGEDALRVRTCTGAGFDRVVFDVTQVGNEARRANFDFDCEQGFQTPAEFRTEASDAFIELRPADYTFTVDGVTDGKLQSLRELEIGVRGRGLTIEGLDLALATSRWTVELANTDTCGEVTFALRYPEPAEALAEPTLDDEGEPVNVVYREELASDRGLSFGGAATPCAAELAGPHVFEVVDQGPYRLDVTLDGAACSMDVVISPRPEVTSVIDLANLSCEG